MATIDKGAKKSIGIMAALIGAAVVVVFVGVTMIKTSMSSSGSKASVPIAGNDENKPLSGADSDYNDKLKVVDADAAKKAKSDGGTYIPISSGIEEDANTAADYNWCQRWRVVQRHSRHQRKQTCVERNGCYCWKSNWYDRNDHHRKQACAWFIDGQSGWSAAQTELCLAILSG